MTATGEITTIGYRRAIGLGERLARWARRRAVRASMSDVYLGDEPRRTVLEQQLLLQRERAAALRELQRTTAMSRLSSGRL